MPSFMEDKNITKLCGAEIKKSAPAIPEREREREIMASQNLVCCSDGSTLRCQGFL
jgi:hypothetical protein